MSDKLIEQLKVAEQSARQTGDTHEADSILKRIEELQKPCDAVEVDGRMICDSCEQMWSVREKHPGCKS